MLRGKKEIEEIVSVAYNKMVEDCTKFAELNKTIQAGTTEEVMTKVSELISSIGVLVRGASACLEDATLPEFLHSYTGYEGNGTLAEIDLTVKTKLKAVNSYKLVQRIAVDENLVVNCINTFLSAITTIFYMELAQDNLDALNEKVTGLVASEGLPFEFGFVLSDTGLVSEITDTKVVFNVSLERALEIQSLPVFSNGTEYSNICAESESEALVEGLKSVQTTTQLLKAPIKLIQTVCNSKSKKRADILIRQTYHKQAKFLANAKAGIGYVEEEVEVNGEKVSIFALVKKSGGEFTVELSPFDINLLVNVDYDVLASLKASVDAKAM